MVKRNRFSVTTQGPLGQGRRVVRYKPWNSAAFTVKAGMCYPVLKRSLKEGSETDALPMGRDAATAAEPLNLSVVDVYGTP